MLDEGNKETDMWTQLKYAFYDIKRKKLYYGTFFLQVLIVIILVSHSILLLDKKNDSFRALKDAFDIRNAYYVSTESYYNDAIYDDSEIMSELYSLIEKNDGITHLVKEETSLEICNMPDNGIYQWDYTGTQKVYDAFSVTKGFFDVFQLEFTDDSIVDWNCWSTYQAEHIPVILGYAYRDFLSVNDILEDNFGQKYVVKGFLQKGQSFVNISFGEGVINLDETILVAAYPAPFDDVPQKGNMPFEVCFDNMTIVGDEAEIQKLREVGKKSEVNAYEFKCIAGVADYMELDTQTSLSTYLFIAVTIIVFSTLMLVIQTLDFIKTKKREFAIHIFCGATKKSILYRILFQILCVVVVADVVAFLFLGEMAVILLVSAILWCICFVTCIPGFVHLFKTPTNEMLRRNE